MAELAMEMLGWSVSQTMRPGVPDCVVSPPVREDLQRRRHGPPGGPPHHRQDGDTHTVNTVCGQVAVPNPRWQRCAGPSEGQTFRPTAAWRQRRTSPEWLYLKTKGPHGFRSPRWRICCRTALPDGPLTVGMVGVWGPSGEQRQIPCRHPNASVWCRPTTRSRGDGDDEGSG